MGNSDQRGRKVPAGAWAPFGGGAVEGPRQHLRVSHWGHRLGRLSRRSVPWLCPRREQEAPPAAPPAPRQGLDCVSEEDKQEEGPRRSLS